MHFYYFQAYVGTHITLTHSKQFKLGYSEVTNPVTFKCPQQRFLFYLCYMFIMALFHVFFTVSSRLIGQVLSETLLVVMAESIAN